MQRLLPRVIQCVWTWRHETWMNNTQSNGTRHNHNQMQL
jgi:hypothetical protein